MIFKPIKWLFSTLVHYNHQWDFIKYWYPSLTLRDSHLVGLGCDLGTWIFKAPLVKKQCTQLENYRTRVSDSRRWNRHTENSYKIWWSCKELVKGSPCQVGEFGFDSIGGGERMERWLLQATCLFRSHEMAVLGNETQTGLYILYTGRKEAPRGAGLHGVARLCLQDDCSFLVTGHWVFLLLSSEIHSAPILFLGWKGPHMYSR